MNIDESIHKLFIDASCDDNLIHTNGEYAQILGAKDKIVHGIHQLIIVFNFLKIEEQEIINYRVHFLKPISVNEEFEIEINRRNSLINVNIYNERNNFTTIMINVIDPTNPDKISKSSKLLTLSNYKNTVGLESFDRFNLNIISKVYPDLLKYISSQFLLNLLTISYYYGVNLKINNFMLVSLNIKSTEDFNPNKLIKIKSIDNAELHYLHDGKMVFESIGKRISFSESRVSTFRNDINLGSYSNQKALVLGGTGSLGRALIKLLIRDQSEIHMTYNNIARLKHEDFTKYNKITFWKYTVNEDLLPDINGITHIYYLITPKIFSTNKPDFLEIIYQEFLDIYITNVLKVYAKYSNSDLVAVFTPSTTAIEEKTFNLKEYIKAKIEMEKIFATINFDSGKKIFHFPRLPAFDSFQTINIPAHMKKDPLEIVHKFIIPPA
jgi:hypothetical protein